MRIVLLMAALLATHLPATGRAGGSAPASSSAACCCCEVAARCDCGCQPADSGPAEQLGEPRACGCVQPAPLPPRTGEANASVVRSHDAVAAIFAADLSKLRHVEAGRLIRARVHDPPDRLGPLATQILLI